MMAKRVSANLEQEIISASDLLLFMVHHEHYFQNSPVIRNGHITHIQKDSKKRLFDRCMLNVLWHLRI